MLREGTWLFRHACSNTQIGAQNARQKLLGQTVSKRPSTVQRFAAIGRPPSFSSLAEQEEAIFDVVDDMHNTFGSSFLTASTCHATCPYQKFTDLNPMRHDPQFPVHFESIGQKQTRIRHSAEIKTNRPPVKPIRLESHRDYPVCSRLL
jgi:hypothetical protein